MIKKIILSASLLISLAACSDSKSEAGPAPVTAQNVTDTRQCSGRTPVDTSLYSNKWTRRLQATNGVVLTAVLDFNHGRAISSLYAKYKDQNLKLKVSMDIVDKGRVVSFGYAETAQDFLQIDGRPFPISLTAAKSTARYKFAGPCLLLTYGSETTTFVPYRR